MATLGEQLKANQEAIKARENSKLYRKSIDETIKREKERSSIKYLLETIMNGIVGDLARGKVPAVNVKDYNNQEWLRAAASNCPVHDNDLWQEFKTTLRNEELDLQLLDEHDGVGISSWIVVTVKAL